MTDTSESTQAEGPTTTPPLRAPGRPVQAYGVAATGAFCLLVFGSNIAAPILPIYRDRLDLTTVTLTALFAVYLVGLVVTFTVVAHSDLARHATRVLPIAVALSFIGDFTLLAGNHSVEWLFVGRAVIGVSVGLGTGAAATIVLATRGERGRAVAATGTLLGSFLGLLVSAVVADTLPGPTTTIYGIHMALLTVAAAGLAWTRRKTGTAVARLIESPGNASEATPVSEVTPGDSVGPRTVEQYPRRVRLAGYTLGMAGWAIGGVVVALLPTVVTEMTGAKSMVVASLGPIVLIGVACTAPRVVTRLPSPVSAAAIGVGAILCYLGVWTNNFPTLLACCVVWGVGQGFAYGNGLKIVTAGLGPVDQGRIASQYASMAYGLTSVLAMTTGWIATAAGTVTGLGFSAAVFVVLCAITIILGHRRWPALI